MNTDTTGTGIGGVVTWNYTVAASRVEYLAKDQTKVESFTITLDDGNGGTVDRTIDVTITGTNDAPVVADVAQKLTGDRSPSRSPRPATSPTAAPSTFTDVDLHRRPCRDRHHDRPCARPGRAEALLTPGAVTTDTTGSASAARSPGPTPSRRRRSSIWPRTRPRSSLHHHARRRQRRHDRSQQSTSPSPAPTMRRWWRRRMSTGAVTEQVTPAGNLTDSGTITFTDVDLTEHQHRPDHHGLRRGARHADRVREHRHHRHGIGGHHLELQRCGLRGRVSGQGPDQGRELHHHARRRQRRHRRPHDRRHHHRHQRRAGDDRLEPIPHDDCGGRHRERRPDRCFVRRHQHFRCR